MKKLVLLYASVAFISLQACDQAPDKAKGNSGAAHATTPGVLQKSAADASASSIEDPTTTSIN